MKQFVIKEVDLRFLVEYLADKPYRDVFNILPILQSLPEFKPVEALPNGQ